MISRLNKRAMAAFYRARNAITPSRRSGAPEDRASRLCAAQLASDIRSISASQPFDATDAWEQFRSELRTDLASKDPLSFLSWPEIKRTMFYEAPLEEWRYIKKSRSWKILKPALKESPVGSPTPYLAYPTTSGNLVHHAYHAEKMMREWGLDAKGLGTILEIGGGYGSMCRLWLSLGFAGRYTIFDLPEFNALQRYFLSMLGLLPARDVRLISGIEDLRAARDADLAIMTWSLSEMPTSLREEIFERIGKPRHILIAYQEAFEGIDNRRYFTEMNARMKGYEWRDEPISHIPGSHYLFGKRI